MCKIKKKYHLFKKRDMPVIDDSDYETSAAEQWDEKTSDKILVLIATFCAQTG